MSKTVIKASKRLGREPAMKFIRKKLTEYDLGMLSEIKWRDMPVTTDKWYPGAYGNAKHPWPFAKTDKARNTYRISCSIRGTDAMLPTAAPLRPMPRRYGPWKPPVKRFHTVSELMVYIMGHEMYHYLAWTGQVSGSADDEYAATVMGNTWVDEYRKGLGDVL